MQNQPTPAKSADPGQTTGRPESAFAKAQREALAKLPVRGLFLAVLVTNPPERISGEDEKKGAFTTQRMEVTDGSRNFTVQARYYGADQATMPSFQPGDLAVADRFTNIIFEYGKIQSVSCNVRHLEQR